MKEVHNKNSLLGQITNQDRGGYILLSVILLVALFIGLTDEKIFNSAFANEDGIVENGTTLALFCVSILCGYRLILYRRNKKWAWLLGTTLFCVLFFFAAGEEISWGQRIFGWETGEFFKERNAQKETNIHNLVVGDTKLNKLIFSQLLGLAMLVYLLIWPVLYRKLKMIRQITDQFAVPVVQWHHTLVFIIVTVVILIIPAERKWEVYELSFGLLFFLIFLNPLNKSVFKNS